MRKASIPLVFCIVLSACSRSSCENEIITEEMTPNGKKVATLFSRSCGATTANVQAIVIRDVDATFSAEDPKKYVFTMQGDHKVAIQWIASDHLVVTRPRVQDDIFVELSVWDGSAVSYRSK